MPDIAFRSGDGKNLAVPQRLSSLEELWFSKIMFPSFSVLYY